MISKRLRVGLVMIPVVMLLMFGLASPASAISPTTVTAPVTAFTVTGSCSFDVLLAPKSPQTNQEKITTFFDQAHNERFQLVTGALQVVLTNVSTGKSVDLNISGPTQVSPLPDGSLKVVNLGPTLFLFQPGVAPSLPLLALIQGRTESMFDALGNYSLLSVQGTVADVCALLS